jgi:phage FluMu gp28-like protein
MYGGAQDAQVFKVTFDDAVENGLFERVCLMTGEAATEAGKKRWYNRIRNGYGPRKAAMREELDAIPRDSGGMCIPGVWIERAMPEERPVLRLLCDDDFDALPNIERKKRIAAWIKANLEPLYNTLDHKLGHVAGMDFARHRHFSVITPLAITQNLYRSAPFVIEMQNTPIGQQMQILWALLRALPKFGGCAIDATGPGMGLAELTADEFGRMAIHQVDLSRKWYGEWMPKMTIGFEDGIYNLPRDANLEADLRAVETIDGIQMVPKVNRKDLKDPDLYRHGDFAISLALAEYMAINRRYGLPDVRTNTIRAMRSETQGYDDRPGMAAY